MRSVHVYNIELALPTLHRYFRTSIRLTFKIVEKRCWTLKVFVDAGNANN